MKINSSGVLIENWELLRNGGIYDLYDSDDAIEPRHRNAKVTSEPTSESAEFHLEGEPIPERFWSKNWTVRTRRWPS